MIINFNFTTNPYDNYIQNDLLKFEKMLKKFKIIFKDITEREKGYQKYNLTLEIKDSITGIKDSITGIKDSITEFKDSITEFKDSITEFKDENITGDLLTKSSDLLTKSSDLLTKSSDLLTEFNTIIENISYYPLSFSLDVKKYDFNIITDIKDIIKIFVKEYLNLNVNNVLYTTFSDEKSLIAIFTPMDENDMIIYDTEQAIMNLINIFDIEMIKKYQFGTNNPIGKYVIEKILDDTDSNDFKSYNNITLTKISNSDSDQSEMIFDMLLKKYATDGIFGIFLDGYSTVEISVIKEIALMWDMEILKEYYDVLILKNKVDFGDITVECWLSNALTEVMSDRLPKFSVKGLWMYQNIKEEQEKAKLLYLAFRAYDHMINDGNEILQEVFDGIILEDNLEITASFASLGQVNKFINNMNSLLENIDKLLGLDIRNLEELHIKRWIIQKKGFIFFPLGIKIGEKIFLVGAVKDLCSIPYNLEKEKDAFMSELKKHFLSCPLKKELSSNKLVESLTLTELLDIIMYNDAFIGHDVCIFGKYLNSLYTNIDYKTGDYIPQEIMDKGRINDLNILGLVNIGTLDGFIDNIKEKFLVDLPYKDLKIEQIKENVLYSLGCGKTSLEDTQEQKLVLSILGKVYECSIYIESEELFIPFLTISVPESLKEEDFQNIVIKIWKCSVLLSPWCKFIILKLNKFSMKLTRLDVLLMNAADSIEDGKRALKSLESKNANECSFVI